MGKFYVTLILLMPYLYLLTYTIAHEPRRRLPYNLFTM